MLIRKQQLQPPSIYRFRCFTETIRLIENPIDVLKQHTDSAGETFTYYFGGVKKVLVSSDAKIIRHVLKTNHSGYHKSPIQTKHMVQYLGPGLLSDNWEEWRPKRRLMQRGFQASDLDNQSRLMQMAIDDYMATFEKSIGKGPVNLSESLCTFVFAMTARALLGISMSPEDICQISSAVSKIQSFMVRQVFQPYLNPWFMLSGQVNLHQALRREGDQLLLKHIKSRLLNQSTDTHNLLDELLSTLSEESKVPLTLGQVLAETMQFIVAGHETSSNALTWIFTLLGQHPAYREAMLREFDEILGSRSAVYSDLGALVKTSAIIDEAMRLYPPFWMLDRVALKDDNIGGLRIKKGDNIMCFIYGLHRNPALWDEPDTFRPERFYTDKQTQKDLIHIPFGAGPRRCIAAHFAKIQIVILLQSLLRRYHFDYPEESISLEPRFTLGRKNGFSATVRAHK
jgi:cytochrome P450